MHADVFKYVRHHRASQPATDAADAPWSGTSLLLNPCSLEQAKSGDEG